MKRMNIKFRGWKQFFVKKRENHDDFFNYEFMMEASKEPNLLYWTKLWTLISKCKKNGMFYLIFFSSKRNHHLVKSFYKRLLTRAAAAFKIQKKASAKKESRSNIFETECS